MNKTIAVFNVLSRHHGIQHLLHLIDSLLHTVRLSEQLVEGQSIKQALLLDLGHLHGLFLSIEASLRFLVLITKSSCLNVYTLSVHRKDECCHLLVSWVSVVHAVTSNSFRSVDPLLMTAGLSSANLSDWLFLTFIFMMNLQCCLSSGKCFRINIHLYSILNRD